MRNVHPPNANTKRRTILFFEIGMILALSFVLWAFNYSSSGYIPTPDTYENERSEHEVTQIGEIIIEPDQVVATKTETQPHKDLFEIRPDDPILPEPGPTPEPIPSRKPSDGLPIWVNVGPDIDPGVDNSPVTWASRMPEFPGGEAAMKAFIAKELDYPELAIENGIQGQVILTFIIEKDGSLSNIEILKSVGWGIDDEAIRMVKSMPKWSPGENNYRAVRVRVSFPIKFVFR